MFLAAKCPWKESAAQPGGTAIRDAWLRMSLGFCGFPGSKTEGTGPEHKQSRAGSPDCKRYVAGRVLSPSNKTSRIHGLGSEPRTLEGSSRTALPIFEGINSKGRIDFSCLVAHAAEATLLATQTGSEAIMSAWPFPEIALSWTAALGR